MSDFVNTVKVLPGEDELITHNDSNIYSPSGSNDCVVLSVSLCNKTTSSATVELLLDAGTDGYYLKDVVVPAKSTHEVMSGQKYVIKNGETLKGRCSAATTIDCIMNGLEQA